MEKIKLSDKDILLLSINYPTLEYIKDNNTISGVLYFDLTLSSQAKIRIKDSYCIEISLYLHDDSCLPTVRETNGKIQQMAARKRIKKEDLHLNSTNGEMCIIIPPKEKERYPNGFQLKEFLYHIEEHLYWVSYFDRYGEKPWKDQNHSDHGYLELFKENRHKYRQCVKLYFEKKYNVTYVRQQFNYLMRQLIKREKI
jgi:hypothetical protein